MPRPPRVIEPNGVYHVTSRGNRREPIFVHDRDRRFFVGLLAAVCTDRRWSCRGYCLMPNHYHVVVATPDTDLSAGMHALNGEYAHYFNAVHGTVGHVFQARFHAVLVESDPERSRASFVRFVEDGEPTHSDAPVSHVGAWHRHGCGGLGRARPGRGRARPAR